MKINTIINRHIFAEMIPPFFINIVFFLFVFLMAKVLELTDLIVNYKVGLSSVFLMLFYSIPFFLQFVIPMSIMMAILLTFLRLSSDNEIIALEAGGISIYSLLPPAFLFCFIGFIVTGFMTIYGMPWGWRSFKGLTFELAASNFDVGIKERTFNDSFKDVMFYVNKIDTKNKLLIDVFIEDKTAKNIIATVVAPRARLFSEPEKLALHLRLYNGTINQVDMENKSVNTINFDTYDINLYAAETVSKVQKEKKDKEEMSITELYRYLKDYGEKDGRYNKALMDFHRKFSIPFSCFFIGLLAVPLGCQSKSGKKSYGLGLGLIFFLLYYFLLTAGWGFGESGTCPPVIGMWIPNIAAGGVGFYLLVKTANERPLNIDAFAKKIKRLVTRLL
jgi:lipopolysaccharide export system permease protein